MTDGPIMDAVQEMWDREAAVIAAGRVVVERFGRAYSYEIERLARALDDLDGKEPEEIIYA